MISKNRDSIKIKKIRKFAYINKIKLNKNNIINKITSAPKQLKLHWLLPSRKQIFYLSKQSG